MVLNGAHLGRAASIAARAVVRLGAIVAPQARIPVGWVAAGDPARSYPPGQAETGWSFLPVIFGIDDAGRSIVARPRDGHRGSGRATLSASLFRVAAPSAAVAAGNNAPANAANAISWADQQGGQAYRLAITAGNCG
jgi:hypothetical protein